MEFHEKLQELRKKNGLTQEQLAEKLYVSRAAVSKWESGRGYPSIDSLKAIAAFYSVSIDELLSGGELLTIAEDNQKQAAQRFRSFVFALLDLSAGMFLFLPLFGQQKVNMIRAVSLLSLTEIAFWLKAVYLIMTICLVLWGILTLLRQVSSGVTVSLLLSSAQMLLFILSSQPYASVLAFLLLAIKAFLLLKKQ